MMCILCVLQKASRRARTLLPWLVIALIVLWVVSQLLPPPFRLEMTPTRLACVLFLVGYFSWYEILMPQLSVWRARRSARLRERRWIQAIELQKLRKAATRRCRNCLTPYRDQNPGGGKFMCSYCGHISKRPVLGITGPPESSWNICDLFGRNGWICTQDWQSEGTASWIDLAPRFWLNNGDDRSLTEKSYTDAAVFTYRILSNFLFCVRWLGTKLLRLGSSSEDGSLDADHQGLSRKGENEENYQERKGEKARRKAEEKRRVRFEKETLEEEERKQREDIARLIEEQRKLRDEKLETKKENLIRGSGTERGRDARKESEKKQERRKEKNKCSSKSNSDGEELEKRASMENERKRESGKGDRRDFYKTGTENKTNTSEPTQSVKAMTSKSRYFDRVKGSFLSSSRGFNGVTFFGKGVQTPAISVMKPNKHITATEQQTSNVNRKESHSSGHVSGKYALNGDDKTDTSAHQPTVVSKQPQPNVWKNSWHQLFNCSSAISPSPDMNSIKDSSLIGESKPSNGQQLSPSFSSENQIHFGQQLPCPAYPLKNNSVGSNSDFSFAVKSFCLPVGMSVGNCTSEDAELFEDPCYVPDPVSLIGPVSESLDSFPVDLDTGFAANTRLDSSSIFRISSCADMSKPSPIESPISRLRLSEQKHNSSGQLPGTPRSHDSQGSSQSNSTSEPGIWQMWGSPLVQDPLSLIAGSGNHILPVGHKKLNQEEVMSPLTQNAIPHILEENPCHFGIHPSLNGFAGNHPNSAMDAQLGNYLIENDPWLGETFFQPLSSDIQNKFSPFKLSENVAPTEVNFDNPKGYPFELPSPNCWSK